MKYKNRLVLVTFIVVFTFTVISLLVQDLVEDDDFTSNRKSRYYDRGLGYIQGQLEDALGFRKVVKNPDVSLKSAADLESQLRRNRKDAVADSAETRTDGEHGNKAERKILTDPAVDRLIRVLEESTSYNFNMAAWRQFVYHACVINIARLIRVLDESTSYNFSLAAWRQLVYHTYVINIARQTRLNAPRLSYFQRRPPTPESPAQYRFFYGIRKYSLYDPEDPAVDDLLHDMAHSKILRSELMPRGTELKLLMEYDNRYRAVFKPMRWPRETETLPNHFYFNDFERHHAEIAAFHLDRLLGFYSVPPVTGRLVNVTKEIFLLTSKTMKKTFYVSPIGNICFYGECTYYCDSRHSFCGEGDMIEGSLMAYLPTDFVKIAKWRSPYRRSYSKFRRAVWENDDSYCETQVKTEPSYHNTKLLLDTVDSSVFDFLTGNMDRHHTEIWSEFGNHSFVLRMDNGRGFGKTKVDEYSIIAPLRQCCVIRQSTVFKLLKLYIGPETLSVRLDESMKRDPLWPILTDKHLEALDRRLVAVLRIVSVCVEQNGGVPDNVIINDQM